MTYNIEELKKLWEIRKWPLDDKFYDDIHISDRGLHEAGVDLFLKWLEKMESKGKIEKLKNLRNEIQT